MITRETDYAIRALLYLALQEEGAIVSTTVLAEEMEIPYRFLRRILLGLVEHNLVVSTRGKQGGLRLARHPEAITLLDVIQAVDPGAITLNICLSTTGGCHRSDRCVVHEELVYVQAELHRKLAELSFAVFVERERIRKSQAPANC